MQKWMYFFKVTWLTIADAGLNWSSTAFSLKDAICLAAVTYYLRPTISGPHTKQRFRSCSMCFSPHSVSKTHEQHFDQQNGNELFVPTLSVIPFLSCQVSSKIVKQCQSPLPLWQSYCWSRWILSDLRESTVLCFKASINKSFSN